MFGAVGFYSYRSGIYHLNQLFEKIKPISTRTRNFVELDLSEMLIKADAAGIAGSDERVG